MFKRVLIALYMSILAKYKLHFESGDVAALEAILHDEFTFTPHVGDANEKERYIGFRR